MTGRKRSSVVVLVAALGALAAALVAVPHRADAQYQPRCGSAEQAFASAVGDRLSDVFGRFGRSAEAVGGVAGTVGFENVNDVWSRCAERHLDNNPPPDDDGGDEGITRSPGELPPEFRPDPDGQGGASGDPHVRTHDGVGYGFQAAGDFVLVSDPEVGIEIQARFGRNTELSPASTVRGVAMRIGDDVVSLNDVAAAEFFEGQQVRVNGEPMLFLPGGWHQDDAYSILRVDDTVIVTTDAGYAVNYTSRAVIVDAPTDRGGNMVGLLGDNDDDRSGDVRLADGAAIDTRDTDTLYGRFLDDWIVNGSASLFTVPFDPITQGPVRPREIVTLDTLDADTVSSAVEVCAATGLIAGLGLEECTFDVAVTGDESWAQPDVRVMHGAGTTVAAVVEPRVVSTDVLTVEGASVAVADTLEGVGTAHEYVLAGDSSVRRVVRVGVPCGDVLVPAVTVLVDESPVATRPLVCGSSVVVPAGNVWLHVAQRYATEADYAITVAPVGRTDLGSLGDQDDASVELLSGDLATGQLNFAAGERIYVASDADACRGRISVTNGAGETLAIGNACLDLGLIELGGDAPFLLRVSNGSSQPTVVEFVVSAIVDGTSSTGSLGEEMVLEIERSGQVPSSEFDLDAGQRLYIESLASSSFADVVLRSPSGEEIVKGFAALDIEDVEVTESGRHTLSLEPNGSETGTHQLVVHEIPDDAITETDLGSQVAVEVTVPGQRAIITVQADPGDRLFLDAIDQAGIADVELVDPSGAVLVEALAFEDTGPITVERGGTHRLVIDPRSAAVGEFGFVIHRVPDDVVVDAVSGDEVSVGLLVPGQAGTVTFERQAGQELRIESVKAGLADMVLVAPSGTVVAEGLAFETLGPLPAPETGTYQLFVDPRDDKTGVWVWQLN